MIIPCPLLRHWFTLTELIIVVAILSILLSLLSPSLKRALDHSNTLVCASKIKDISAACLAFTEEHDGRFPGNQRKDPPYNGQYSWMEQLNTEIFEGKDRVRMWAGKPGDLFCPEHVDIPTFISDRDIAMNIYMNGGTNWGGNPHWGPDGLAATAPASGTRWNHLGTVIYKVARPSQKFLLSEQSNQNFSVFPKAPLQGSVVNQLGDNSSYPAHSALDGMFAFRHMGEQSMNIAFVDGHLEKRSFFEDINSEKNFFADDE